MDEAEASVRKTRVASGSAATRGAVRARPRCPPQAARAWVSSDACASGGGILRGYEDTVILQTSVGCEAVHLPFPPEEALSTCGHLQPQGVVPSSVHFKATARAGTWLDFSIFSERSRPRRLWCAATRPWVGAEALAVPGQVPAEGTQDRSV